MLFPLQCYIWNESAWNLSIWHLGFFCLLSNKVYGLQSFITWSQCVVHTGMVTDASQLVLLSAAAIIRWKVFFFLRCVLGYTHRADFWINELAQVFNCGFHFMGLFFFFPCISSFTTLTLKVFLLIWEQSSWVFLTTLILKKRCHWLCDIKMSNRY